MDEHIARALQEYIDRSRYELKTFGADLDWDSNHWAGTGFAFSNFEHSRRTLVDKATMLEPFLSFAKAYVRCRQSYRQTKEIREVSALRCVEYVLRQVFGTPCVTKVTMRILDDAAQLATKRYSKDVAYAVGRELEILGIELVKEGLVPANIDWKNTNPKEPDALIRTGPEAQERRQEKLPDPVALDAVAEIFHSNPQHPRDVLTVCTTAALCSAPFRISQLLRLEFNCERYENEAKKGLAAYGLSSPESKGAASGIKWVPASMWSVCQAAISKLTELTNEARAIAAWLEDHPDRFYRHERCPQVKEDEELTPEQAATAIGLPCKNRHQAQVALANQGLKGPQTLRSLNQWVHKHLPKDFPYFSRRNKDLLKFRDALFTIQYRSLHLASTPSPVLIDRFSPSDLHTDLEKYSCREKTSIFERHGYDKGRSEPLKLKSNQMRHMLNTMAQRGGLSEEEIARWSHRKDIGQNRVYDHRSEHEMLAALKQLSPQLKLSDSLQSLANQIQSKKPIALSELNLTLIPTAHITEWGFCIHNWISSPCTIFRDCANCTEHVCIKGDPRLPKMKKQLEAVQALKTKAEAAIEAGAFKADRWYQHQARTEVRLSKMISSLENPSVENGTIVQLPNTDEVTPFSMACLRMRESGEETPALRDAEELEDENPLISEAITDDEEP